MTVMTYDPTSTMLDARTHYFTANGFGDDGGYSKRWVQLKLGPVPFVIPNTQGRVRAVRYHDLHHVLTGYRTDWIGEFEISAWELGSGCRDMWAAWGLNLSGMAMGFFVAPKRVTRAFMRGRKSRNLYDRAFSDDLLRRRVGELRAELGLDQPASAPTAKDRAAFVGYAAAAFATLLAPLALVALALVLFS